MPVHLVWIPSLCIEVPPLMAHLSSHISIVSQTNFLVGRKWSLLPGQSWHRTLQHIGTLTTWLTLPVYRWHCWMHWTKTIVFWLIFHLTVFLVVQLTNHRLCFKHWFGTEQVTSLPEPIVAHFSDAYMCHEASVNCTKTNTIRRTWKLYMC